MDKKYSFRTTNTFIQSVCDKHTKNRTLSKYLERLIHDDNIKLRSLADVEAYQKKCVEKIRKTNSFYANKINDLKREKQFMINTLQKEVEKLNEKIEDLKNGKR